MGCWSRIRLSDLIVKQTNSSRYSIKLLVLNLWSDIVTSRSGDDEHFIDHLWFEPRVVKNLTGNSIRADRNVYTNGTPMVVYLYSSVVVEVCHLMVRCWWTRDPPLPGTCEVPDNRHNTLKCLDVGLSLDVRRCHFKREATPIIIFFKLRLTSR